MIPTGLSKMWCAHVVELIFKAITRIIGIALDVAQRWMEGNNREMQRLRLLQRQLVHDGHGQSRPRHGARLCAFYPSAAMDSRDGAAAATEGTRPDMLYGWKNGSGILARPGRGFDVLVRLC